MKIKINAQGREIEIDGLSDTADPREALELTLNAWRGTEDGPRGPIGEGVGFTVLARPTPPSSTMRVPVEVPE